MFAAVFTLAVDERTRESFAPFIGTD